ncbi:unnamed protein product [Arctogadus glacialis]
MFCLIYRTSDSKFSSKLLYILRLDLSRIPPLSNRNEGSSRWWAWSRYEVTARARWLCSRERAVRAGAVTAQNCFHRAFNLGYGVKTQTIVQTELSKCEELPVGACKGSVVPGICGCCRVCARQRNESCGGVFGLHGTCDRGLRCVIRPPENGDGITQHEVGVCEGE